MGRQESKRRGAQTIAGWAGLVGVIALAAAAPVAAQTVRVDGSPVRAGGTIAFHVTVPAEWGVEQITVDPIGYGLDTFVRRLSPPYAACPAGQACFSDPLHVVDERARLGEHTVTFVATGGGRTRTLTARIQVEPAADDDHDGLPDTWERREGVEPWDRLGTSAPGDDPDGDGVTNADEFRAGTPALGRYVQYFGDNSPGERQQMTPTFFGIQPGGGHDGVRVRAIGDDGRQAITSGYGDGNEIYRASPVAANVVPDRVLMVEVASARPLAIQSEMSSSRYGHIRTNRPTRFSNTWLFAEGASRGPVDVFLLAYNPGPEPVPALLTFFRSATASPIVRSRLLPPGRTTIWLNADEPQLAGADHAVMVEASSPILVDRGLRWHPPGRTAPQESVSPGSTALQDEWYFPYIDGHRQSEEELVLANPNGANCEVEVTVFGRDRDPRVLRTTIGVHARQVLRAADLGGDAIAAVRLRTTNRLAFVAEHVQRGLGQPEGRWTFATPGAPEPAREWALASVGYGRDLLLLNPTDEEATIEFTGWYSTTYDNNRTVHRFRAPARRLTRISLAQGETPWGAYVPTASVRSLPRADGSPGPAIVVGTTRTAGVLGARDARIETNIGLRVP